MARFNQLPAVAREPTVLDLPRILLRAFMRTLARLVLALTGVTFVITVGLLSCVLWLATWPSIHRQPRSQRLQATTDLVAAGMEFLAAFGLRQNASD